MTMEEIVQKLMEHADEYAVESMEQIVVGTEPKRKHRKWRTQKKWIKRYGIKPIVETKKCRKIDVTLDLIVEFCSKEGLPLPTEITVMMNPKDNKNE